MRLIAIFATLILFISVSARSGVLIEPLVGYQFNGKFSVEDGDDYSGMGAAFGGRLGYQKLGIQLGLDYLSSTIDVDDDDFNDPIATTEMGVFAGYEFPILVRVYAGYIFSASGKTKNGSDQDYELNSGSGMKLGASFTGLPFLAINVEYRSGSFEDYTENDVDKDKKIDFSALLLSISLPLDL